MESPVLRGSKSVKDIGVVLDYDSNCRVLVLVIL
jgi:hypothetical protein